MDHSVILLIMENRKLTSIYGQEIVMVMEHLAQVRFGQHFLSDNLIILVNIKSCI